MRLRRGSGCWRQSPRRPYASRLDRDGDSVACE
ncbi:excalibur calcium-binding domain-containing protein [Streptomyces sp. NPDC058451]